MSRGCDCKQFQAVMHNQIGRMLPLSGECVFGRLAGDELLYLIPFIRGVEAELYAHAEAGMAHLYCPSHAQLQLLCAHDQIHHGVGRERSGSLDIAAARADIAQSATVGNTLA
jgi:hypothetical protein